MTLGKKPIKDWEKPLRYGKPCGGRAAMTSLHTEHADEGQQHCCCMDDCFFSMGIDGRDGRNGRNGRNGMGAVADEILDTIQKLSET
jgi:hypothetical protein